MASTVFAPEFNSKGDRINKVEDLNKSLKSVFLSVIPSRNCSYVLISYLRKDANFLSKFTNDFMSMRDEIKTYFEGLLLTHSENMFFSIEFVDKLDQNEKKSLHRYFLGSTMDVNFEEGYSLDKEREFGLFLEV